jgi:hypothetical protein
MLAHTLKLLNETVIVFAQVPSGFWQVLLASGVLSPFLKAVQHWWDIQSEKLMIGLVILFAFVAAGLHYLLTTPSGNPSIIAVQTALIGFTMQPIYFLAVKPLYRYLTDRFGAAKDILDELKTASVPAAGLPIAGTTVSAEQAQAALNASLVADDFRN